MKSKSLRFLRIICSLFEREPRARQRHGSAAVSKPVSHQNSVDINKPAAYAYNVLTELEDSFEEPAQNVTRGWRLQKLHHQDLPAWLVQCMIRVAHHQDRRMTKDFGVVQDCLLSRAVTPTALRQVDGVSCTIFNPTKVLPGQARRRTRLQLDKTESR